MASLSGSIVGYDPGGNGKHGFSVLQVANGAPTGVTTSTLDHAEEVLQRIEALSDLTGIGVDTMTCWCTGKSGLRPADRWLRKKYDTNSVVSPNGMYGSMGINGMSVLSAVRQSREDLFVTETHPKVLYQELWAESGSSYGEDLSGMNDNLTNELGTEISASNDHEWDAAVSTLPALRGLTGRWTLDLHGEASTNADERLVFPCGNTHYYWPSE